MKGVDHFGEFQLDTVERSLQSGGRSVPLAPKALDVLIVLVESRGKIVEKDDLIRQVWPNTFVEDNNLAFNVSVLRKLFGESGTSPRYIETVPRRGYRFVAQVRETVPDAAPSENEDSVSPAPPRMETASVPGPSLLRRFRLPALALLFLAIAVAAGWRMAMPVASPRSLAVLPFRALDLASADDSLEVGLTDSLITQLSRSLSIPVRPMSAVMRYRNRPEDPLGSGGALGVDAILEGTFQKHAGRIRSSVRLLRTRDGKVLYSEVFDQKTSELFLLEDSLTTELAGALSLKLAPEDRTRQGREKRNPVAYAAWLKGRYYWNQRTSASIHRAIDFFHDAINADPSDALAYAGLADAYLLLPSTERIGNSGMMILARAAAERAIGIDPGLAEPHASLGLLSAMNYDADWAAADLGIEHGDSIDPDFYSDGAALVCGIPRQYVEESANLECGIRARIAALRSTIRRHRGGMRQRSSAYDHQFGKSASLARQSLSLDPRFTLGQT